MQTISSYLDSIEKELNLMHPDRHEDLLAQIASYITQETGSGRKARLHFICTHNSRRSQFAQAWAGLVQQWMEMDAADCVSGGTEVTACNERTIEALKRAGCTVTSQNGDNPVYTILTEASGNKIQLWSKLYDDETSPDKHFAAVMTCDHADANCPFIPGADKRFPLTYTDPKYADDTDMEQTAYDMTCKMIATDMVRLFKKVKKLVD